MNLAIMQPYLLPYLGYFQLMQATDRFVFYDDVAFINRGWINRNQLLAGGQARLFTMPLQQASQNRLICEIDIDDSQPWRKKLLQNISQNYRRAPFFEEVFPLAESLLTFPETNLSAFLLNSFRVLLPALGLRTELVASSRSYNNQHLRAQARILDICLQEGATAYTNAIGGKALYEPAAFAGHGIKLTFIRPNLRPYRQSGADFVAGLSILDVLMFNSPQERTSLLADFTTETN